MKASRQSNRSHWTSVGRRAKQSGIPIERVLTKVERINAWIREGYGNE